MGPHVGKPFNARRLSLTSMMITADVMLQLVGEGRISEGWLWIRDTQFKED